MSKLSFHQPSLFSKHLALPGGPSRRELELTWKKTEVQGRDWFPQVLGGAWHLEAGTSGGKGLCHGLQGCPSVRNGPGPFVAKGLVGSR